jgi:hypothetical protein
MISCVSVSLGFQLLLHHHDPAIRLSAAGFGGLFALSSRLGSTRRASTAMLASRANASPFCERTAEFSYALVPAPSGFSQENRMAERRGYEAAAACSQAFARVL